MVIDSHAHLEMSNYNSDRDDVIARARERGVDLIISIGIDLEDSRQAVHVADSYDMVYAAVGVHPHHAKDINGETYDYLLELAVHDKVVAYGEIGLDFFKKYSPRDIQIKRFGEQMELAAELGLPVIIHDRDAHVETLEMLETWKGKVRGVVHCFSGDYEMAKKCIDMGYYVSIPGTITYKNSSAIRDVVRKVPIDCLLVETDAPFLTPEPMRGKRNEPAYVIYTAQKIADIKGLSFKEVARITSKNTRKVFRIS